MGFKSLFKKKKKEPLTARIETAAETIMNSQSGGGSCRLEEELEQVFKRFDLNGDGKICAAELGAIMRSLGQSPTAEELNSMIREVDTDGDGFIDLREFIELNTSGIDHDEVTENLRHAFEVFDVDKNGSISAAELRDVLRSLGEECTLEDCSKMISGVDTDGSGGISFDEFKVMMIRGSRFDVTSEAK